MIPPQIQAPLFAALLFIAIGSPATYKLTNDLLTQPILKTKTHIGGMPTKFGLLLHAVVYFVISYFFLKNA